MLFALLVTFAVMYPTLENQWLNWDDDGYVLRNPMVWELDGEHVEEMFTTPEQVGLYHPLTMLSLAIDYQFWETDAFGYHLTNLLFHLLNVCLVLFLLQRLGGGTLTATLGAVLFGMHPMHVESVAWISTRKDVLYSMFFLLALLTYLKFRKQEGSRRWLTYAGITLLFVAALLSKAIALVFPAILLLIDYLQARKWSLAVVLEKVPFFVLAGVALVVAGQGQESSDSMVEVGGSPIWQSLFIGTKNYLIYLGKCFVPIELSPFHPFPFQGEIEFAWWYYLTPIPLIAMLVLVWRKGWWRTHRELVFGLAFFTICIGPYLQIIPYGKAIMAERYTYMSYLGLFFALGILLERWEAKSLSNQLGKIKFGLVALVCGLFAWLTLNYIPVWENGETLWTRVIEQYPDHNFGFASRGQWRIDHNNLEGGESDLSRSIELNEHYASPYYERGRLREGRGEWALALADYDQAIARMKLPRAYLNRAMIRANYKKDLAGAKEDLDAAIVEEPEYALAYLNRALVHRGMGLIPEAEADYNMTIELEPWNTVLYRYRGSFYEAENRLDRAFEDFNVAVNQEPDRGENWFLRARVRRKRGDEAGYQSDVNEAGRLGFQFPEGFP